MKQPEEKATDLFVKYKSSQTGLTKYVESVKKGNGQYQYDPTILELVTTYVGLYQKLVQVLTLNRSNANLTLVHQEYEQDQKKFSGLYNQIRKNFGDLSNRILEIKPGDKIDLELLEKLLKDYQSLAFTRLGIESETEALDKLTKQDAAVWAHVDLLVKQHNEFQGSLPIDQDLLHSPRSDSARDLQRFKSYDRTGYGPFADENNENEISFGRRGSLQSPSASGSQYSVSYDEIEDPEEWNQALAEFDKIQESLLSYKDLDVEGLNLSEISNILMLRTYYGDLYDLLVKSQGTDFELLRVRRQFAQNYNVFFNLEKTCQDKVKNDFWALSGSLLNTKSEDAPVLERFKELWQNYQDLYDFILDEQYEIVKTQEDYDAIQERDGLVIEHVNTLHDKAVNLIEVALKNHRSRLFDEVVTIESQITQIEPEQIEFILELQIEYDRLHEQLLAMSKKNEWQVSPIDQQYELDKEHLSSFNEQYLKNYRNQDHREKMIDENTRTPKQTPEHSPTNSENITSKRREELHSTAHLRYSPQQNAISNLNELLQMTDGEQEPELFSEPLRNIGQSETKERVRTSFKDCILDPLKAESERFHLQIRTVDDVNSQAETINLNFHNAYQTEVNKLFTGSLTEKKCKVFLDEITKHCKEYVSGMNQLFPESVWTSSALPMQILRGVAGVVLYVFAVLKAAVPWKDRKVGQKEMADFQDTFFSEKPKSRAEQIVAAAKQQLGNVHEGIMSQVFRETLHEERTEERSKRSKFKD